MSEDDDLDGDEEVQRQLARAALAPRLSPAALQVQERDNGALGRTPVGDEDTRKTWQGTECVGDGLQASVRLMAT
jgi:hypothetical protein